MMKDNPFLKPAVIGLVTLLHAGVIALSWNGFKSPEPEQADAIAFVDLGSVTGDDKPLGDGAPAPLEQPEPPQPQPPVEQPKPEPKVEPKPEPKPQPNPPSKTDVESSLLAGVTVGPNPCADMLRVLEAEQVARYAVLNLAGQVLQSGSNTQSTIEIQMQSCPAGLYVLRLTAHDGGVRVVRIVKL